MISKATLTKNIIKNKYLLIALTAVIGFLDASYLTIEHYQNALPPCTLEGCEKVLTSDLSVVFGVPLSLIGALFYITVIILAMINYTMKNKLFEKILLLIAAVGFCISIFLLMYQIFIVHAICQYCIVSLITSTTIFGFSLLGLNFRKKKE